MSIPTSMGSHKLEIRKGNRTDVVDYTGIPEVGESINAGRVVSLNAGGRLILSAPASNLLDTLFFFAWSGHDENNYPDVQRLGQLSGAPATQTRNSNGYVNVGEGQFGTIAATARDTELSSTAVNPNAAYAPGARLTFVSTAAADASIHGLIIPATADEQLVIGRVAPAGLYNSPDGYPTVAFYPGVEILDFANVTLPSAL